MCPAGADPEYAGAGYCERSGPDQVAARGSYAGQAEDGSGGGYEAQTGGAGASAGTGSASVAAATGACWWYGGGVTGVSTATAGMKTRAPSPQLLSPDTSAR